MATYVSQTAVDHLVTDLFHPEMQPLNAAVSGRSNTSDMLSRRGGATPILYFSDTYHTY